MVLRLGNSSVSEDGFESGIFLAVGVVLAVCLGR